MSYQTILVYAGLPAQVESLLNITQQIAATSENVHIIGLHVVPQIPVYPDMAFMVTSELADMQREALLKVRDETAAAFEKTANVLGLSWEWRSIEANGKLSADCIMEHSRCIDLLVGAQENPDTDNETQHGVLEQVLIESGRPVLFVPYAGAFDTVGKRIMIAWNASREASRATFDALPLLKQAEQVEVVWANPQEMHNKDLNLPGSEIAGVLARHGVNVVANQTVNTDVTTGDELLSRLADHGFDTLVMGGYGHSRFREFVFGGTTRHILQQMTVPVLMSH